jgi:D-amino-acid dehydrogenase
VAAITSLQRTAAADLADLLDTPARARFCTSTAISCWWSARHRSPRREREVDALAQHGVRRRLAARAEVEALVPGSRRRSRARGITGNRPRRRSLCGEPGVRTCVARSGGEVVQREVDRHRAARRRVHRAHTRRPRHRGDPRGARCGAWSKPLAAQLGYPVPLDTERGYHLTLPGVRPGFRVPVASFERKAIMTPMSMACE